MNDLICFSTGESIKRFKGQLAKLREYDTLAYGNAFGFVLDQLKIEPKYWIFADPHAISDLIPVLLKRAKVYDTILFVMTPMMESLEQSKKYHGTPGKHPKYDWKTNGFVKFNKDLDRLSEFIQVVHIETGSYKKEYWDDITDVKRRMWGLLQDDKFNVLPVHGFSGDKLHSVVLPFATTYLKYDNIYLAGFDGKGPRFNHGTGAGKERNMMNMQDTFLPFWKDWLCMMQKHVYSLIPDKFCRTNKFFPYVSIEQLL